MPSPFRPQDLIALAVDVERGRAPRAVVAHFERLAGEYAFQSAYGDPDQRLEVADVPGYLLTRSGRWNVYVPWPLAFAFPGPVVLDGLVEVAERAMVGGRGNVAVSGSTAFAGRISALGDIDLAQYLYEQPQEIPRLVELLIQRSTTTVLVRVKCGVEHRHPWTGLIAAIGVLVSEGLPSKRIKFDFLDGATPFGLMPVSNVLLPSREGDRESGAARESFVFQEAVLVEAGGPPWPLVRGDELFRYLKFLIRETRAHLKDDNPIKALKRALSLARLLGLDELSRRAEEELTSGPVTAKTQEKCLGDMEDLWSSLAAEHRAKLQPLLTEKRERVATIMPDFDEGHTIAIVDEILAHVGQLLANEGSAIEKWAS